MTPMRPNMFCGYCGNAFTDVHAYPRRCTRCGAETWANPVPVAVALVPIVVDGETGLLVVRRAIPPVGKLALVGGFIEDHETWQVGAARELREEVNVLVDPATLSPMWFVSTEPEQNRILLFASAPPIEAAALPRFEPNSESSERAVVFGSGDATEALAFPLHAEAARRYFGRSGPLRARAV
jgi:ADP-ribose pyrophosphatase YjhB (NUDIX family)